MASLTAPWLDADPGATARRVRSPACIATTLASDEGLDACAYGLTPREAATAALLIITNDKSGGFENWPAGRRACAA